MARVKLEAGAEFDILSGEEYKKQSERLLQSVQGLLSARDGSWEVREGQTGTTSGSGNAVINVHRVPQGSELRLHRLSVDYEGSNASTPVTCDLRLCRDLVTPSGLIDLYNIVPAVVDYGFHQGPIFREGQIIVISVTGGPASTQLSVGIQFHLRPTKGGIVSSGGPPATGA
jgi:hypothetical protein